MMLASVLNMSSYIWRSRCVGQGICSSTIPHSNAVLSKITCKIKDLKTLLEEGGAVPQCCKEYQYVTILETHSDLGQILEENKTEETSRNVRYTSHQILINIKKLQKKKGLLWFTHCLTNQVEHYVCVDLQQGPAKLLRTKRESCCHLLATVKTQHTAEPHE